MRWTTEKGNTLFEYQEKKPKSLCEGKTPLEVFSMIVTDEMIDKIKSFSNERISIEMRVSEDRKFLKFYLSFFKEISDFLDALEGSNQYKSSSPQVDLFESILNKCSPSSLFLFSLEIF